MFFLIGPRRTVINRGFAYWSVVDGRNVVTACSYGLTSSNAVTLSGPMRQRLHSRAVGRWPGPLSCRQLRHKHHWQILHGAKFALWARESAILQVHAARRRSQQPPTLTPPLGARGTRASRPLLRTKGVNRRMPAYQWDQTSTAEIAFQGDLSV